MVTVFFRFCSCPAGDFVRLSPPECSTLNTNTKTRSTMTSNTPPPVISLYACIEWVKFVGMIMLKFLPPQPESNYLTLTCYMILGPAWWVISFPHCHLCCSTDALCWHSYTVCCLFLLKELAQRQVAFHSWLLFI